MLVMVMGEDLSWEEETAAFNTSIHSQYSSISILQTCKGREERWERGDKGRQGDKGGGTREEESGRKKNTTGGDGQRQTGLRGEGAKEGGRETAC
ncbi:hypothetical protein JOQ06_018712, partial [Pogonophryne albipinna]